MSTVTKLTLSCFGIAVSCSLAHAQVASSQNRPPLPAACGPNEATPPGTAGTQRIADANFLAPQTPGVIASKLQLSKLSPVDMSKSAASADQGGSAKKGHPLRSIVPYYMKPTEREGRRFVIYLGNTYYADGRQLLNTNNRHQNTMNYVMDLDGNFYLFDESACNVIRHGSIFDGHPVAGAGNIRIANGRIICIDGASGHYPASRVFKQVLNVLKTVYGVVPQATSCKQ